MLETYRFVKHQFLFRGIRVGIEIAETLELEMFDFHCLIQCKRGFYPTILNHQRVRIEMVEEGLAFFTIIGIGHAEETVEQTDFSFLSVFHGSPMDGGLYIAVGSGHPALC